MNIFILDPTPTLAAQYQCDKHVVKMTLETAQLLSTAIWLSGGIGLYKPTHTKHPCSIWAAASKQNFNWLVSHGVALAEEYRFRYGKTHACEKIISESAQQASLFSNAGLTPFAQAMPDSCKDTDPVKAYRRYYIRSKASMAKWTKRNKPDWFVVKK